MIDLKKLTHYLELSLASRNQPTVPLVNEQPIEHDDLVNAKVPEHVATELMAQAKKQGLVKKGDERIPVVISLLTLLVPTEVAHQFDRHCLLLVPAKMRSDGTLFYDSYKDVWVPFERLAPSATAQRMDLYVCLAADYFVRHKALQSYRERIRNEEDDWLLGLGYAKKLFDDINEILPEDLQAMRAQLIDGAELIPEDDPKGLFPYVLQNKKYAGDAYIMVYKQQHTVADPIRQVYSDLSNKLAWRSNPKSALQITSPLITPWDDGADDVTPMVDKQAVPTLYQYLQHCGDEHPKPFHAEEEFPDNPCFSIYGHVSAKQALSPSQRQAVYGVCAEKMNITGDSRPTAPILAISGPPGTGKTAVIRSIVANLLVEHAMEGKDPPIVIGLASTNQAVGNMIRAFEQSAYDNDEVIGRWLPRIVDGQVRDEALPSMGVYFPSDPDSALEQGFEVENIMKTGAYSTYSSVKEEGYILQAQEFFLSRLHHAYPESQGIEWSAIPQFLQAKISEQNQQQAKLYEAYWQCEEFQKKFVDWQDAYALCVLSEELTEEQRQKEQTRLDTVIAELESMRSPKYNTLRACLDQLRKTHPQGFSERGNLQFLSVEDYVAPIEDSLMDEKFQENFLRLQELSERTFAVRRFWLAMHYYEYGWLQACLTGEIIPEDERQLRSMDIQKRFFSQLALLFPCMVMTAFRLPKVLRTRDCGDDVPKYLFDFADLLLVDEAGQLDTAIGLAAFSFAKRAVVVGDTKQLAPIWEREHEYDQIFAKDWGISEQEWTEWQSYGLTVSSPSNLMTVASALSPWKYPESKDAGGFLLMEHFRSYEPIIQFCNELMYDGLLLSKRRRYTEPQNPLRTLNCPMVWHAVSGGVSEKNGSSRINRKEAQEIIQWVQDNYERLYKAYSEEQPGRYTRKSLLGVVTPFKDQAAVIRKSLKSLGYPDITVGTAHVLQGAECAVILFSPVYGNGEDATFIEKNKALLNVAVSRAKDCFIMFCSRDRQQQDVPPSIVNQQEEKPSKQKSVFELLETHLVGQDTVGDILKTRETESIANVKAIQEPVKSLTQWQQLGEIDPSWDVANINLILAWEGWIKNEKDQKGPTERGLRRGIVLAEKDNYTYAKYTRKGLGSVLDLLKDKNPRDRSTWSQ